MPRFFFNILDGQSLPDEEGTELPDVAAARAEAVVASGEAIRELGATFWNSDDDWRMEVKDETGTTVITLRMSGESD